MNCFHGVLGIISPNFYTNKKIDKSQDVWLAIWKVDKNLAQSNSLGMDMLDYVEAEFCLRSISAIGINNTVALLYKLIGFKTKKMNQWFLPNRDVADSKLIVGNLSDLRNKCEDSLHSVIESGIEQENEIQTFLLTKQQRELSDILYRDILCILLTNIPCTRLLNQTRIFMLL